MYTTGPLPLLTLNLLLLCVCYVLCHSCCVLCR
jgi:hypothetical protein